METTRGIRASRIEARLAMLQEGLDLIDQGFTLIDRDLKLVFGNRTFARLLDFPDELMQVGTPFEAFMRYNAERGEYGEGDVEQLVAARVDAARRFTRHSAERVRPNGQVIAIRGEPLSHQGFVTLYTDVTAQREAERIIVERNADLERRVQERTGELEAAYQRLRAVNQVNLEIAEELRRSEAKLRLMTDAMPACVAYIDSKQVFRFANRGYVQWFNRAPEGLLGQHAANVLDPALHAAMQPHLARALAGEPAAFEYALAAEAAPPGELRYTQNELVPERADDGEVLGAFVLSIDVTQQKQAQAALMQAQKMEAVGQLAGGIAHDLNNMLTVVLGNLATMEERAPGRADTRELVEPALLATRRAAALIKRLLTFSRQQRLEPRPVDLRELIDGLETLLRRTLPENIALSIEFDRQLDHALTDPHQLENALLNLALNARDAMPAGGRLSIRAGVRDLDERTAADTVPAPGRYVCIRVADTGCGMDEATRLRACEPFFTTKQFGLGSGLGLSMVYGFAQQSGGALAIRSAPDEGTELTLLLPAIAEPAAVVDEQAARPPETLPQRPLVLLVEDDAEVRQVVRRQLLDLGHTVLEAANGAEALALLEQVRQIAIVISDVVMPGTLDGPALGRRIRRLRPDVALLLVSGYECASDGVVEFNLLSKPFTKSQLAAALAGLTP